MKKSILYTIALGLLAIMVFAGPAAAFAPQPEPPYIGKLGSIANQASAVDSRVNAALTRMGIEPSPFTPIVNRLQAEDQKLDRLNLKVSGVLAGIEELGIATEPSIRSALKEVLDVAEDINMDVTEKLRNLGDMDPKEVVPYLFEVQDSSQAIVDQISPYLAIP